MSHPAVGGRIGQAAVLVVCRLQASSTIKKPWSAPAICACSLLNMIDWIWHQTDVVLGQLTKDQWEAWRGSATTLGGLIALFIGVRTYRRNVKLKREEQARLVYARVQNIRHFDAGMVVTFTMSGSARDVVTREEFNSFSRMQEQIATTPVLQVTLIVHNGSKELVGRTNVQLVDTHFSAIYPLRGILESLPPESTTRVELTMLGRKGGLYPSLGATVAFSDASGQWWRRHLAEPVKPIHRDPGNEMKTPAEDNPSWRIQLRRALRKERGVAMIP
jgi:hypothetical protein